MKGNSPIASKSTPIPQVVPTESATLSCSLENIKTGTTLHLVGKGSSQHARTTLDSDSIKIKKPATDTGIK